MKNSSGVEPEGLASMLLTFVVLCAAVVVDYVSGRRPERRPVRDFATQGDPAEERARDKRFADSL